ncbi:hypothetical protein DXG01_009338 [Tephrocybe rancida]|nr:hypothetical protein DXG01_009338 [Tephrocybe rancida]
MESDRIRSLRGESLADNPNDAVETTPLLYYVDDTSQAEGTMTMFWHEMHTIPKYAFPVLGLIVVEVVSVGHISTPALAAVSLGSMTANVTGMSMLSGLTSALDALLPSAYTSSHPELVGLWSQRMAVIVFFAIMPISFLWLRAEAILLYLHQDPEIARLSGLYLRWLVLGLPAPFNAVLSYILVWGPEPIRLGFIGAPISTVVSYIFVSFISIFYGAFVLPHVAWHPISSKMFTRLGFLFRLGLYGIGQIASEWWAWEVLALAASYIGPISMASQSILLTSATTTWHVGFAVSNASAVRVGNLLGAKDARRARVASSASLCLASICSIALSSMYLIFRASWARMFSNDPDVISLVTAVIPVIALFQIVDANACVTAGLLRATGRQFTGALLNISAYYVFGLPFGVWLAFNWHWQLQGLWLGVTIALLYCSIVGTTICIKTDWQQEVERAKARIEKEDRPLIGAGEEGP